MSFHPAEKISQLVDRPSGERLLMRAQKDSAAVYFMGSEILAEAFRELGNLGQAVQILQTPAERKYLLLADQSSPLTGALWLRIQAQLAQLYREIGRDEDARRVESELRSLLVLADWDHPIVLQLERTQN